MCYLLWQLFYTQKNDKIVPPALWVLIHCQGKCSKRWLGLSTLPQYFNSYSGTGCTATRIFLFWLQHCHKNPQSCPRVPQFFMRSSIFISWISSVPREWSVWTNIGHWWLVLSWYSCSNKFMKIGFPSSCTRIVFVSFIGLTGLSVGFNNIDVSIFKQWSSYVTTALAGALITGQEAPNALCSLILSTDTSYCLEFYWGIQVSGSAWACKPNKLWPQSEPCEQW